MRVGYLSKEFFEQLSEALHADEQFVKAIKGQIVAAQMLVRHGPEGDITYYQDFDGTEVVFSLGEIENPDVNGEMEYETAVASSKGELDQMQAMMSRKVKFQGNMVRMMGLLPAFRTPAGDRALAGHRVLEPPPKPVGNRGATGPA